MRKMIIAAVPLLLAACTQKKTLTQQLALTLSNHLVRLDSSARIDSVHILWKVPVTDKLGKIIDDSVYIREYNRLKGELASALQHNEKDSIAFVRYEMGVMEKELDSMSKGIDRGDTTEKFGTMIGCAYILTARDHTWLDSTMLFVDSTNTLRFTDFLDSSLARTIRHMQ